MNVRSLGRRVLGTVACAAVATAGLVTVAANPAVGYATAPCDPAGVSATDNALSVWLAGQLQGGLRTTISGYRMSCARMVVNAVRASGMDRSAAIAAIIITTTTTIVESGLQNVAEQVDHDSLGLLQQRALWGSSANRLDPTRAANAFLAKLRRVPVTADRRADLLATRPDGTLVLYPNQHDPGPVFTDGIPVGAGWQEF